MVPLLAAAVLGVSQPAGSAETDPPGPDVWCADDAITDGFCQLTSVLSSDVYKLPELGGFFVFVSNGQFIIGSTDEAQLTGNIVSTSDATVQFSAALDLTGAKPADPGTVTNGLHDSCCDALCISSWIQFTGISGELVGLPGSIFDGARYAIAKRDNDAQFGDGANTHDGGLGLFAKITFELINPLEHPTLPVGPFVGEVSVSLDPAVSLAGIDPSCFPPAEPDLTGTWTGTVDCVGFDAEVNFSAEPVEDFFSSAVLLIGRSTNLLDVGDEYSVRLTRETGNSQSFCAYAPNNPGSTTGGQGVLVEPHRQATRVYFRFEGETLKARELIADGLHGTQLCKWSFTRTSTDPPAVADACAPLTCFTEIRCDDNALCGQGPGCNSSSITCTCEDGFVGAGIGPGGCTPAP